MVKHFIFRIVGIFLLLAFFLNAFGCTADNEDKDYIRIDGNSLYYVTEKEKLEWKTPLIELMTKAFTIAEEWKNSPDYELLPKNDETAIAMSYSCGLLDITMDGIPELLVYPYGYYGSSGTTTYFIYDIYSGEYLGDLEGGGGESICFYYDTESNLPILGMQYWIRCGWDYREYSFEIREYDSENKRFLIPLYLSAAHQTYFSDEILADGSRETYDCIYYSSKGLPIGYDTYFEEQQAFEKRYIRMQETELLLIQWHDIPEREETDLKIEQMAEALLSSKQKFFKP